MTAQNLEIIQYALLKCNVIDENSSPSAEQGVTGLNVLNDMLLNEQRDGLRLGWFKQTNLAANAPLRDEDIYGVKMLLTRALAAHYGIVLEPPLADFPGMPDSGEIAKAHRQLIKRSLAFVEADLGELSRPQGGPWGGPNYLALVGVSLLASILFHGVQTWVMGVGVL